MAFSTDYLQSSLINRLIVKKIVIGMVQNKVLCSVNGGLTNLLENNPSDSVNHL